MIVGRVKFAAGLALIQSARNPDFEVYVDLSTDQIVVGFQREGWREKAAAE